MYPGNYLKQFPSQCYSEDSKTDEEIAKYQTYSKQLNEGEQVVCDWIRKLYKLICEIQFECFFSMIFLMKLNYHSKWMENRSVCGGFLTNFSERKTSNPETALSTMHLGKVWVQLPEEWRSWECNITKASLKKLSSFWNFPGINHKQYKSSTIFLVKSTLQVFLHFPFLFGKQKARFSINSFLCSLFSIIEHFPHFHFTVDK